MNARGATLHTVLCCAVPWLAVVQVLQDKYEGLISEQFQDDFAYYAETAFKT